MVALIVEAQDSAPASRRFVDGLLAQMRQMPVKKILAVTVHKIEKNRAGESEQAQTANTSARPPHFVLQISAMQADALPYADIGKKVEGLE